METQRLPVVVPGRILGGIAMSVRAFHEIYTEHQPRLLAIAFQRLNDRSLAEDITAEVFRIAWEHRQNGGTPSLPWLYKTLRNLIANQYRKHQRDLDFLATVGRDSTEFESAEDVLGDTLMISRGLQSLGEKDQEILRMAFWEDLSRSEMATILGCNTVAVRVRLTRAKNRLRAALTDDESRDQLAERRN